MAAPARSRTQAQKPADKAPAKGAAPPGKSQPASRGPAPLPSPPVAAEILDAAERTTRPAVRTPPVRKPAVAKTPAPDRMAPKPMRPARVPVAPMEAPKPPARPMESKLKTAVATPLMLVKPAAPSKAAPPVAPGAKPGAAPAPAARAPAAPAAKAPAEPSIAKTPIEPEAPKPAAAPAAKGAPPAGGGGAGATEEPAPPTALSEGETPSKSAKPSAEDAKAAGKEGGGEKKPTEEGAAEGEPTAGGGAGGAAVDVKLHIPEPPTTVSPATAKRIGGVQRRAGGTSAAKAALPPGGEQVGDARQAVTPPSAEAKAKAQEDLIAQLDEKPAVSPEIVKLCERIREVIRKKRPPDEDALMEAKPEGEALNAGNQLNSTVEGETKKVQGNYSALDKPPEGTPAPKGGDIPPQPAAAATPGVNATAATPDAVPAANVSLDKDAEASKKKMQDAGMETPAAQLVQSGPVADARGAQGELDQAAKEDPAKVLAGQKQALGKAEEDMAALQAQALASLTASRAGTVKAAGSQQTGMVVSEETKRANASAEAQNVFNEAQKQVKALLDPLASNAINEWEAAKEVLVSQFKADLAVVQKRVEERHAGVGGWFVGVWDVITGLPDWAEDAYTKAEKGFGDGVIAKITEISLKVNTVIATCIQIIKNAKGRIAQIFSGLGGSLAEWAAAEQAKFDGQLDKLKDEAVAARDNFNKDLVERSSAAVDEVRAQIADLRKKAGGLVGRIVAAVNRFIEDPVKFIIEGLLELLGIPPASFWAVVAKIKKVIKDIADDPMKFANNLLKGLAQGFGQFFDNFGTHLFKGFISWLTGSLGDVGVQLPKDFSLKSIITFFLQLMGITWPRIRKILVKQVGEKNVALVEKVYSLISLLIEKGPEGIVEMIKEKLDPQSIVDQVIQLAVEFMISAIVKAATARIIALFNPAGAIIQALEAIYRVLKWIFQNAARIFTLIETVVNGIADILAGSLGGFANAVEKALAMLIAPVISFIADYLGFGDLPSKIADKIKSFQEMILGYVEKALVFLIEKGKALLAALGIGGKEKKDGKGGTPHEQAVEEVAATLAEPIPGEPLAYDELRAKKEEEAATIVAARNQSLAAEQVKMSVTFADKSSDEADEDLDFTVTIAPNTATAKNATPLQKLEPIAGLHVVERKPPVAGEKAQSHHVPAKGLGTAIGDFLDDVAAGLGKAPWKGDERAAAIAAACRAQAKPNHAAAKPPGGGLSAILVDESAHTKGEGVHTVEGSATVLHALAERKEDPIVVVKKRTETKIGNVTSYVSVNPQIPSWRAFLADVRQSLDDPKFQNRPGVPRGERLAVELILDKAEQEFEDAETTSEQFLDAKVLGPTNEVLDRSTRHAYTAGKATVGSALETAKVGTPGGRAAALSSLDSFFEDSWQQFRGPITP